MQRPAAALLCMLMTSTPLPAATRADGALAAIDACVARLDPEIDESYARVAARCPQLGAALRSSNWAAWLPADWDDPHNRLSATSLAALRELVTEELVRRPIRRVPEVARLRPILANLARSEDEPRTSWIRLREWLRAVLAPHAETPSESRFTRFFGHVTLSQALLQLISYATVVLVVGLAAFIVAHEWRASARRIRLAGRKSGGVEPKGTHIAHLSWQDIEAAPAGERPRLLLEVLAARLSAARRLPVAAALTVRELTRAAKLAVEDRARLLEVALESERVRYAAHSAAPAAHVAVMNRGRQLLERLDRFYAGSP